jgi:predicted acylesterase/phospholipase RssA
VQIDYNDPSRGARRFWDGGILSNTPLRETIQAHEDYWTKVMKANIPDLDVSVANIWPYEGSNMTADNNSENNVNKIGNEIPTDLDGLRNRLSDLRNQDKTPHEEKVAYLIRDYIDLINKLREKLRTAKIEIDDVLDQEASSKHRNGKKRTYRQLIEKKVRIVDVTRIQRKWDANDISSKMYDYSSETITSLIERGVEETLEEMVKKEKEEKKQDASIALRKFIDIVDKEKETEQLGEIGGDNESYNILKNSNMYDLLITAASKGLTP